MTVFACRTCGHHNVFRSRFEADCAECGSDDLEQDDAYDPIERELRCEQCGYEIDTSAEPDADWGDEERELSSPNSVDDPCPFCGSALVPAAEAMRVRDQPEYKLAREAAHKLRGEHELPGPPYNPARLAHALGLEVVFGDFKHDGMLIDERIEIPSSANAVAQRFAIAHEIAHHVLGHDGERSKIEPEANAFASELLIPRPQLMAAIASNRSATALRKHFGVSRDAMVYALIGAGAINKAIH